MSAALRLVRAPAQDSTALLVGVAKGSRADFARLYDATSGFVFTILNGMLRDRAESEEVLQEVYIRIWTKAHLFDPTLAKAEHWIAKIARHAAIDVIRTRGRRPSTTELDDVGETAAAPQRNPEQELLQKDMSNLMSKCLEQMPPEKAQALQFAYGYGYSYEELVDKFNVPMNTLKSWLRRGLITLKDCVAAQMDGA